MFSKISPLSQSRTPLIPAERDAAQPLNKHSLFPQLASVVNRIQETAATPVQQAAPDGPSLNRVQQQLAEKLPLYHDYLRHGNNPPDLSTLVQELEATLGGLPQAEQLRTLLPALHALARQGKLWRDNKDVPAEQQAAITRRLEVISALIAAFARLPDLLLQTDIQQHAAATTSARQGLREELAESALRRMLTGKETAMQREQLAAQLRQLLEAYPQPAAIRERLDYFYASGVARLQQPMRRELKEALRHTGAVIRDVRHLAAWSDGDDVTRMLTTLSDALEGFHRLLEQRLGALFTPPDDIPPPVRSQDSWLTRDGVRLSVPVRRLAQAVQRLPHRMLPKNLPPLLPRSSGTFMQLSAEEKAQCLALKKRAAPVRAQATELQQAAAALKKALREAVREDVRALPDTGTPEAALYAELLMLTDDSAQTRLAGALDTARRVAGQVLSEPLPAGDNSPFGRLVTELGGTLNSTAVSLLEAVRLAEHNVRQQSVAAAVSAAEKRAQDISALLEEGLATASGVALSDNSWPDKLQLDLRSHWQGITGLLSKGTRRYPVIRDAAQMSAQEKALSADIHLAVLPLLNETEKLRLACRQLEQSAGKRNPPESTTADAAAEKCRAINLSAAREAGLALQSLLAGRDIPLFQRGDEAGGRPVALGQLLGLLSGELVRAGDKLQQASWYAQWSPGSDRLRLTLSELRGRLESIKKGIKDAVESATGTRVHNNPPEGMIAKDAAEWLAGLKKAGTNAESIAAITGKLTRTFSTADDPQGRLFGRRLSLALEDAEQGQLPWPLTADEHLAGTKTQKDYTLAWAEKRLTYGLLYNVLIHGSPAGMLSLYKKSLVSPLRLINLLLTPVRMELTRRGMEKVRPGLPRPAAQLEAYHAREMYQAAFRMVSMLTPQLPKTLAALGIAAYGLAEGGEYRDAFIRRAISRLPGDLFWIGGFALWHQVAQAVGGSLIPQGGQTAAAARPWDTQLAALSDESAFPVALALQGTTQPAVGERPLDIAAKDNPYVKAVLAAKAALAEAENKIASGSVKEEDRVTALAGDKFYTRQELKDILLKKMKDFTYIDTSNKIIDYRVLDKAINDFGISKEGEVDKNYLLSESDFRTLFKDDLLQVVCQHDIDKPFHDYIEKLLTKVITREDVKFSAGGKTYIKAPTAIFYLYNTMLNHVRNFDQYVYYGGFSETEILKFTRLKNTIKNFSDYVSGHYQNGILKEFIKIDDRILHATGIGEAEQRKLLDYLTQPYIDKKSPIYKNLLKDITNNHEQYDTQHIISGVYNKVLDEINKVTSLPLPFMDQASLTGKYITSLTGVLKNAQRVFGGLYYYDGVDTVKSTLADDIRKKITATYATLDKTSSTAYSADCIEKFVAANNKKETRNKLIDKYSTLLTRQLDNYTRSLEDTDSLKKSGGINTAGSAFMAELRQLVANNIESYPDKTAPLYALLDKFRNGTLNKKAFTTNKKEIVKYLATRTIEPLMDDKASRAGWSPLLLAKLSAVDFDKIYTAGESQLLRSGEYARLKRESLDKYNSETIKYLEYGVRLLAINNPDETQKLVIRAFTEKDNFVHTIEEIDDINELIHFQDLSLAVEFLSQSLQTDDDIQTLTQRVVQGKITTLEEKRKNIEAQLYKSGGSQADATKNLALLKKYNVALLALREELKERAEVINYMDDIAANCKVVDNKYTSIYLPDNPQSSQGLQTIQDVQIAAVRHLYKRQEALTAEKKQEYLNIFQANTAGGTPDGYHLQNLASLYWATFYHPSFRDMAQEILPFFGKDKTTGLRKKFGELVNDEVKSRRIKALCTYSSISRLNTLVSRYADIYQHKESFAEVITSGEDLPGTYFSISDIKKRSEIPGHSQEAFAAQFTRYSGENMESDVTVINGQRIRKSGIDVRQLDLKPKAVYAFKHTDRPGQTTIFTRDHTRMQPRDNDVLVVVTQDNSMLLSLAWGNQSAVYYLPPASGEANLGRLPVVVQDLAAYALDYQYKNRDQADQMAKYRNSVAEMMGIFYNFSEKMPYGFDKGKPTSDYLVLDADELGVPADGNIFSWARKNLIVLQKTTVNVGETDTVESIFKQQFRDVLNDNKEAMKESYNDAEDTVGEIMNYTPLPLISVAASARKLANDLPLNDADIGMMIADVIGISDFFVGGVNSLTKVNLINRTRNAIKALNISKGTALAEAKKLIEQAVIKSINSIAKKRPLASFFPRSQLIKNHAIYDFTDLQLSRNGQFLSSPQVSLTRFAKNPDVAFKNATDYTDRFYYDALRKQLGKKKLDSLGIRDNTKIKSQNMFSPTEIDDYVSYILEHEDAALLSDGQYSSALWTYQDKVGAGLIRYTPGVYEAYEIVEQMFADKNLVYGYGKPGLTVLENLGEKGTDLLRRAREVTQGVERVDTMVNKAAKILNIAGKADNHALLNNLKSDIKGMWAELTDEQVNDILKTMTTRNKIIVPLVENTKSNNCSGVCFFKHTEEDRRFVMGRVFVKDISRSIFVNIGEDFTEGTPVFRTVLHESSHFASTQDFMYQHEFVGDDLVKMSVNKLLTLWKSPQNIYDFANAISPHMLGDFLDIKDLNTIGLAHYQAAFDIAQSPNFAVEVIKNNADTYVEFIETLNNKYIIKPDDTVIIDPNYSHSVQKRDISMTTKNGATQSAENNTAVTKLILNMLWQMSRD